MSATFQLRRALQQVLDATGEDIQYRQEALNVLNNPDATDDELLDALDEFTSSIPDPDSWSDELRSAMKEADELLSDLLEGEPQYLQGEIN